MASFNPLSWLSRGRQASLPVPRGEGQILTRAPELAGTADDAPGKGTAPSKTQKDSNTSRASVPNKAEKVEPPRLSINQIWTPLLIRQAMYAADSGNFVILAALVETLLVHSRVKSAINIRVGTLQGLTLDADHPKRKVQRAFRGYYRKSRGVVPMSNDDQWIIGDFWRMMPGPTLKRLMAWAWMAGFALVQLKGRYHEDIDRWVPRFKVWHLRHVRFDFGTGQWKLKCATRPSPGAAQQVKEIVITPGDGEWFIFTPFTDTEGQAADRPWAEGIWRGLAEIWLLQNYGITDWGRYSASKGKGLFVGTTPLPGQPGYMEKQARDEYASDIDAAGEFGVMVPPPGCDVKSVADASKAGHEGFQAILSWFATEASIAILNGNLLQDVKEGSRAAAEVQKELLDAGVTKGDAETLSDWMADGPLPYWVTINYGDGQGPYPRWFEVQDELAERKAGAETLKLVADAITALIAAEKARLELNPTARRVDFEAILEQNGVPMLEPGDQPDVPPPGEEEPDDPSQDPPESDDDIEGITPEDPEDDTDEVEPA